MAFSGGVPENDIDADKKAREIIEESFEILKELPIAIQTGGTHWDIQGYAAKEAKKNNMFVIGIYPTKAIKYVCKELDFGLEIKQKYGESHWGDDTEVFAKIPHGMILIGGSSGSAIEFSQIMKINERKVADGKDPTYISPVIGISKEKKCFSDVAVNLPFREKAKSASLPDYDIFDGRTAARFITKKLKL